MGNPFHKGPLPPVGDKAVSAEVQATSVMEKNLCTSKSKIHKDGEREREIGTMCIMSRTTNNQKYNNQR